MDGGMACEPIPAGRVSPYGIPWEAAVIPDKPWWLPRLLGAKFREDRGYRMRWGEWSWRWGIAFDLINWSEDGNWSLAIQFIYGKAYVRLPFLPHREPKESMLDSWGFSWDWADRGADIHMHWGERTKILHLPWEWGSCVRHDMLCDDGVWRKAIYYWNRRGGDPRPAIEAYDYRYVCRDGTVQDDITAVIQVEEREWRWLLARWLRLPWPRMVRRCIDVEFSAEVGERRGSWKGGTIGCGYEMRLGEMPIDTLRRMQRDRRF